jgi:hypothetical protein
MSQEFVKKQLTAPATAKFPRYEESFVEDLGSIEHRFRVTAYVDSQNSFGALLRTNYTCIVKSFDAKTWHCESMDID